MGPDGPAAWWAVKRHDVFRNRDGRHEHWEVSTVSHILNNRARLPSDRTRTPGKMVWFRADPKAAGLIDTRGCPNPLVRPKSFSIGAACQTDSMPAVNLAR